jgi:hypothetical protein
MTTICRVRVEAVDGPHLTLHVDHVYGWNWAWHLVTSRTLALHLLWEPLLHYNGAVRRYPSGRRVPEERARRLTEASPLWRELEGRDITNHAWARANAGRFVSCVGVVGRRHHDEMWNETDHPRWHHPRPVDRSEVETAKANYLIAATDPPWLAHLAPGMEWDSTAYDCDDRGAIDPAWLTSAVLALARRVGQSGDFAALPVLADALEEAGCADAGILSHCRGPGPHARGCWALDRLLGGGFDPRVLEAADVSRVEVEFWPQDEGAGHPRPVGVSSSSPAAIAAVLAAARAGHEVEDVGEWARGTIRFARRCGEPAEWMFFPSRDPERYELRAAGRVYRLARASLVEALRQVGFELPLE